MKNKILLHSMALLAVAVLAFSAASGQRRGSAVSSRQPIVFAVLDGGKTIEPIGFLDKGSLEKAVDGAEDEKRLLDFTRRYYRPKTAYRLVFGGADAGSVTVLRNDPKAECSKFTADVAVVSSRAKLGGMVMGLATNEAVKKGNGYRRRPTPAERGEIEALVRAEMTRQKIGGGAARNLKSQNLTALDVDADGKAELVGSYWTEPSATERALLFFIAEQGAGGKYQFGHSEFRRIGQDEVMSGEIASVDQGVYHEVLLDVMEYDGDTTDEIFTYTPSFEGAGFSVYSRREGKWVKAFGDSNYRCAY